MNQAENKAGAPKAIFQTEMKRLGQAWAALPANEKAEYHAKSTAEFEASVQLSCPWALLPEGRECFLQKTPQKIDLQQMLPR